MTLSLFANQTLLNQATHCIWSFNLIGAANLVDRPNTILFDVFGLCRDRDPVGLQQGSGTLAQANSQPQTVLTLYQ